MNGDEDMFRLDDDDQSEEAVMATSTRRTYWKDRIQSWHCMVVWPPHMVTRTVFEAWLERRMRDCNLNVEKSVRMKSQLRSVPRYEVFMEKEIHLHAIINHVRNMAVGWRCQLKRQVEVRLRRFKPRGKRISGFSVMTWNANSVSNKFVEIKAMLERRRPTIIALQETLRKKRNWIAEDGVFRLGMYSGFEIKMDPNDGNEHHRGLAIAIDTRSTLTLEKCQIEGDERRMIFGRISGFKSGLSIIIGSIYAPSGCHTDTMRILRDKLQVIEQKWPNDEILIAGDWNTKPDPLNKRMAKYVEMRRLRVIEKSGTTYHRRGKGKSDIDHIVLSSGLADPSKTLVLRNWPLSDHWPVTSFWNASSMMEMCQKPVKPRRMSPQLIKNASSSIANNNRFAALADEDVDADSYSKFVEAAWQVCEDYGATSGGSQAEETVRRSREECFLNNSGRRAWRRVRRLMRQASKTNDRNRLKAINVKLRKARKLASKYLRKASKDSRTHWHSSFRLAQAHGDPAETFAYIKSNSRLHENGGRSSGPIVDEESNTLVTDPRLKAQLWTKNFADLAKDTTGSSKNADVWSFILPERLRRRARGFDVTPPEFPQVPTTLDLDGNAAPYDYNLRLLERSKPDPRTLEGWDDMPNDTLTYISVHLAQRWRMLDPVNAPISIADLINYLDNIARRKSPGPDGVTNEFLRCAIEEGLEEGERSHLLRYISKLINHAWENTHIFEEWNSAVVVPVPKKGDLTRMTNYRGIALMPCLLKVINGIYTERLMANIVKHRMLDPAQVGFVNREEAVAQAATLVEICQRRQAKGKQTLLCFVDLAKAYDSVPHAAMLLKAERFGISGRALKWLHALYASPKIQCRRADGGFSDPAEYLRGVRQGDPLAPALFDIFMDDLLDIEFHKHGVKVEISPEYAGKRGKDRIAALLYADDIVLLAPNEEKMRWLCDKLSEWCTTFEMKVNAGKCGLMVIEPWARPAPPQPPAAPAPQDADEGPNDGELPPAQAPQPAPAQANLQFQLQGQEIEIVTSYTYLGIEITPTLDRDVMVKRRIEACRMATAKYAHFLSSTFVPFAAKALCVKAIIQPTLSYGSEIYGYNKTRAERADSALMGAVRLVTRAPRSVSQFVAFKELNLRTMYEISAVARTRLHWKKQQLSTWYPRILLGPRPKTRKKLYSTVGEQWRVRSGVDNAVLVEGIRLERLLQFENHRQNHRAVRRLERKLAYVIPTTIRTVMKRKCQAKPNRISAWEVRYAQTGGAGEWREYLSLLGSERIDLGYGWLILHRLRTGRYWTQKRLIDARTLPRPHPAQCSLCGMPGLEDEAHYVFTCPKWQVQRDKTLERIHGPRQDMNDDPEGLTQEVRLLIASLIGISCARQGDPTVEDNGGEIARILERFSMNATSDLLCCVADFLRLTSTARFRALDFPDPQ